MTGTPLGSAALLKAAPLVVALALLAVFPSFGAKFYVDLAVKIMILAIFALSLELLVGQTGLVSFGHAAFFGIAAYVAALLTPKSEAASYFEVADHFKWWGSDWATARTRAVLEEYDRRFLQDVFVPEDGLLPNVEGLKGPLGCLSQARYGIAFGVVGAAMACFHAAAEYSKTRVMFGKPIGSFQLVQAKLADMLTEITKAQLLCVQLGRMKERGTATPAQISLAKRNNCEIALAVAREARDVLGANGITAEYPVMRHMCNLESVYTYEGTHNIHTLVLGEAVTGLSAYR